MPNYLYECSDTECSWQFEEIQSIKAEPITICPACGQDTAMRVITGGSAIIDKTPRTVGSLAEANTRKFGREYCEQTAKDIKRQTRERRNYLGVLPEGVYTEPKPTEDYVPPWRPGTTGVDKSLMKLDTQEKVKRYVLDGKK